LGVGLAVGSGAGTKVKHGDQSLRSCGLVKRNDNRQNRTDDDK